MTDFLLVHGAWHGARHWNPLGVSLRRGGHTVTTLDLPGHGDRADLPAGFVEDDRAVFERAPSPIAQVTLDIAAQAVVTAMDQHAVDHGTRPVVVAHSMGGAVVTRAAELAFDLVEALVYVAAFVPTTKGPAGAYLALPEAQTALGGDLYLGDPSVTGAVRMDPRSVDEAYVESAHRAYFSDVTEADFRALFPTLTPDQPLSFVTSDTGATVERWGSLRRSYVRTSADRALPPELQDVMIRDADALAPDTSFAVATIDTGHAPFISRPSELAALITNLTR
jgi:pimeloyl-ACP methyl ester carboxylesterase